MLTTRYTVFFGINDDQGLRDVEPVAEWVGPDEAVKARRERENAYVREHGGYFQNVHDCDQDALWAHFTAPDKASGAQIYVAREIDMLD